MGTRAGRTLSAIVATIGLIVLFDLLETNFSSQADLLTELELVLAQLLLLTLAQTILLRFGRLEPALLGVASLSAAVTASLASSSDAPFAVAAVIGVLVAAILGTALGTATASLTVPTAVSVSIGVFLSLQALADLVIGPAGEIVLFRAPVALDHQKFLGLPLVLIATLAIAIIAGLGLREIRRRHAGRTLSRLAFGLTYGLAAVTSALGGIATLIVSRAAVTSFDNDRVEVEVITAMLVGGASLYRARGGVGSSIVGSAFVTVLAVGILSLNQPFQSDLLFAACAVVSVVLFLLERSTVDSSKPLLAYRRRGRAPELPPT
jgi:ribose transport system permease protein